MRKTKNVKNKSSAIEKISKLVFVCAIAMLALTACTPGQVPAEPSDPLEGFEESDMSGYAGLQGYDGPLPFVDVTVQDVHKLMEDKETFVLFISFANCPWCNAMVRQFTEVATSEDAKGITKIANLDTRKNPAWESNLDIDDYDLFVQDFDEYLYYDDNGIKHLYVPHVFFVKDGAVVYEHQGALAAMGSDPNMALTEAQNEELKDIYRKGFEKL